MAKVNGVAPLLPPEDVESLLNSPFLPLFYVNASELARRVLDSLEEIGRRTAAPPAGRERPGAEEAVQLGIHEYAQGRTKPSTRSLHREVRQGLRSMCVMMKTARMASALRSERAFHITGNQELARASLAPLLAALSREVSIPGSPVTVKLRSQHALQLSARHAD